MRRFKSKTPKRTMLIANADSIMRLDRGRLKKSHMKVKKEHQTTRRYKDSAGKDRYAGTSALKQSQLPGTKHLVKSRANWQAVLVKSCCFQSGLHSVNFTPRVYTPAFALALLDLMPSMLQEDRSMLFTAEVLWSD